MFIHRPLDVFQFFLGFMSFGVALGMYLTPTSPAGAMMKEYASLEVWTVLMGTMGIAEMTTAFHKQWLGVKRNICIFATFVWSTLCVLFFVKLLSAPILFVAASASFAEAYLAYMHEVVGREQEE